MACYITAGFCYCVRKNITLFTTIIQYCLLLFRPTSTESVYKIEHSLIEINLSKLLENIIIVLEDNCLRMHLL